MQVSIFAGQHYSTWRLSSASSTRQSELVSHSVSQSVDLLCSVCDLPKKASSNSCDNTYKHKQKYIHVQQLAY